MNGWWVLYAQYLFFHEALSLFVNMLFIVALSFFVTSSYYLRFRQTRTICWLCYKISNHPSEAKLILVSEDYDSNELWVMNANSTLLVQRHLGAAFGLDWKFHFANYYYTWVYSWFFYCRCDSSIIIASEIWFFWCSLIRILHL